MYTHRLIQYIHTHRLVQYIHTQTHTVYTHTDSFCYLLFEGFQFVHMLVENVLADKVWSFELLSAEWAQVFVLREHLRVELNEPLLLTESESSIKQPDRLHLPISGECQLPLSKWFAQVMVPRSRLCNVAYVLYNQLYTRA